MFQEEAERHANVQNDEPRMSRDKVVSIDTGTFESDILLTAVEFACEALLSCAAKIDLLDKPSIPEDMEKCGSRLASTAKAIKIAIHKKKFIGLSIPNIIFRIALIFDQSVQDPQAELYTYFFNTLGKVS